MHVPRRGNSADQHNAKTALYVDMEIWRCGRRSRVHGHILRHPIDSQVDLGWGMKDISDAGVTFIGGGGWWTYRLSIFG